MLTVDESLRFADQQYTKQSFAGVLAAEVRRLRSELERAEREMKEAREQEPAIYMAFSECGQFIRYWTRDTKNLNATMAVNDFTVLEFYARPRPAAIYGAETMKPDWKDAPDWAEWLCRDSRGKWWWRTDEPMLVRGEWVAGGLTQEVVIRGAEMIKEPKP